MYVYMWMHTSMNRQPPPTPPQPPYLDDDARLVNGDEQRVDTKETNRLSRVCRPRLVALDKHRGRHASQHAVLAVCVCVCVCVCV